MVQIVLQNERICKFYEQNPTLNFEAINLIFVELFEKLLANVNTTMNATINSQILTNVNDNTKRIDDLNTFIRHLEDKITHLNLDITSKLTSKFVDVKKEYVDELRTIVIQNTNENMGTLLEKNNSTLIDKTSLLLNDVVPKSNHQSYSQIQDSLRFFHKSLSDDTKVLLNHMDNNSLKDYINSFEMKSNLMLQNIQQPIYSFIKATEERINMNILMLKENSSSNYNVQNKLLGELYEFIENIRKTNQEEIVKHTNAIKVDVLLNQLYNSADIRNVKEDSMYINKYSRTLNTLMVSNNADKFIIKRHQMPKIVVYNMDIECNVSVDEIREFVTTLEENNCNGVFISQRSGFVSKPHFHIDIQNKLIMVYVHNVEYSPDKIKNAIDIIDNLSIKMREYNGEHSNDFTIDKDVLDEMNKEYQMFISQKEGILTSLKDHQKKMFSQIDDFKLPALDKYLSTKYSAPIHKPGLKCDLCKAFNANNLKALAAHKRGCNRKNSTNQVQSIPLDNTSHTNTTPNTISIM
jgi:hypothetical protein